MSIITINIPDDFDGKIAHEFMLWLNEMGEQQYWEYIEYQDVLAQIRQF